jgi:predicted naringenin-chalcone synthase
MSDLPITWQSATEQLGEKMQSLYESGVQYAIQAQGSVINTEGLRSFGLKEVIPIILIVVGAGVMMTSRKSQISQALGTATIVFIGFIIVAGGVAMYALASGVTGLVG